MLSSGMMCTAYRPKRIHLKEGETLQFSRQALLAGKALHENVDLALYRSLNLRQSLDGFVQRGIDTNGIAIIEQDVPIVVHNWLVNRQIKREMRASRNQANSQGWTDAE